MKCSAAIPCYQEACAECQYNLTVAERGIPTSTDPDAGEWLANQTIAKILKDSNPKNSHFIPNGKPARFLTLTTKAEYDWDEPQWECKVRKLLENGAIGRMVESYRAVLEYTEKGKLHCHVLIYVKNVDKKQGFAKAMICRYWKYAEKNCIDMKTVNYKTNPNSISDLNAYMDKANIYEFDYNSDVLVI